MLHFLRVVASFGLQNSVYPVFFPVFSEFHCGDKVRFRLRPPPCSPRFAEISWKRSRIGANWRVCRARAWSLRRGNCRYGGFLDFCLWLPKRRFPETKTFGGGDTVRILHPECQATACNRQKPRDFGADMLFMRE